MLKSLRKSLLTTAMTTMPFLLSACGDDGSGTTTKFEIVLLPVLLFTVSLIADQLKARSSVSAGCGAQ